MHHQKVLNLTTVMMDDDDDDGPDQTRPISGKTGKCVGKNGENIVKEIVKKIGEKISK